MLSYGVTNTGRVRKTNEDCFALDQDVQLYVVADGMGGHNAGEVAARLAVDTVVEFIRETSDSPPFARPAGPARSNDPWPFGFDPSLSDAGNRMRTAIHVANVRILETSMTADSYSGMGTTIVAALVEDGRLSVGHVGDSRLYLFANDRLRPLTRDDSWMASVMADDQVVDRAAMRHHPMRGALTNVVGTRPRTDVHVIEETLTGGEELVLVTDGVHGVLDDRCLERIARSTDDVREMAFALVGAAIARGSRDNCTAVVARYNPTP
jgi:serine/threonine protein phosphatase PrpC